MNSYRFDPAVLGLDADMAAAAASIADRRGALPPVFEVLVGHPDLALRYDEISSLLWKCGLPAELLEAVFLVVARHFDCKEQWRRHEAKARAAGLSGADIDAIAAGELPTCGGCTTAACTLVSRLLRGGRVDSDAWRSTREYFDRRDIASLAAFVSFASLVSMAINLQGL